MSVPTMSQVEAKAPTPPVSPVRALLVALAVIVLAAALPLLCEVALSFLVSAVYPDPAAPDFGRVFTVLTPATEWIAPAALGGVFWLALLELPRRATSYVWLETISLSALFFSLTLLLAGVVTDLADLATTPALAQALGGPLAIATAALAVPWVILPLAALAFLYSGLGLGLARVVANWNAVRAANALPDESARHFARVYGVASLIMLTLAAFTPLLFALITSPALTNGTGTPTQANSLLVFTWQFILPSAVTAIAGVVSAAHAPR